jgi:hypothetical protein
MLVKLTSPSYQSWVPGMAKSSGGSPGTQGSAARYGPSMRFSYSTALGTGYTWSPPMIRIRPRSVEWVSPSQSSLRSSAARSLATV